MSISSNISDDAQPFDLFEAWFNDAQEEEINEPNAMSIATKEQDGRLSLRMVLLKDYDKRGFVFYTNFESDKGKALLSNHEIALLFHWKSLKRQVRIEGQAQQVSNDEADAYFNSRPRASRIGAWASQQSRPMQHKNDLINAVSDYTTEFGLGKIKRPPHWSGFRVVPKRIEFWQDKPFRLHDRLVFSRTDVTKNTWTRSVLYP